MITIKQLEKNEKKLRKVTEYNEPSHSFSYNELHQRIVGSLEQTQGIVKMIEEELEHREYIEDNEVIPLLKQLLSKIKGDEK